MNWVNDLFRSIGCSIQNFWGNISDDFLSSVFFSLVAAIVFWPVFNAIPNYIRRRKIRPKVEFDVYEFYRKLFQFIEVPLRYNMHTSSPLQKEIFSGKISKECFEIWLQDKCLNESYLYDEMKERYQCIGDRLEEISLDVCGKVKDIYTFTTFLTAKEILLFKRITTNLRKHSYVGNSGSLIGGNVYKPLKPNITHMAANFNDIYTMFLELQKLVFNYKYIDFSIAWDESAAHFHKWDDLNCSYYRGEYKKCLRRFRFAELRNKFPEHLWSVKFRCLYKVGKKVKALNYLEVNLLVNHLQLISLRNSFDNLYQNGDVKRILIKARGEKEYSDMVECLKNESAIYDSMIEQARMIKRHYETKITN